MATVETDEAYARRLHAQELGGYVDAQTPLMRDRQGNMAANPTVINARMNEIASSWTTVVIITIANVPQILAGMIVLYLYWDLDHACDLEHVNKWKIWSVLCIVRMAIYTVLIAYIQQYRAYLQDNPERYQKLVSLRNTIEAFALIWFVVGNMWLFGDDDDTCIHPHDSHIYNLCFSYLIIMYLQICAPCILAILLIPVFCFCLPCFIRVLARLHDSRRTQGATQSVLDSIPVITITEEHSNLTCPICLNELVVGESARSLTCHHVFHQQCVDEWLRVNATCPTCRKPLVDPPQPPNVPTPAASSAPSTHANAHTPPTQGVGGGGDEVGVGVGSVQLMPIATQTPAGGQDRRNDVAYSYEML